MKPRFIKALAAALAAAAVSVSCFSLTVFAEEKNAPEFTDQEQAYISSHPSLKVGYIQDRVPVCFTDEGECSGISRYIFDRVSEISGLNFDYYELPMGSITYDDLLDAGVDLITSVEYNEENKNANGILISEPYLSSRKVIVAKEDLDFRYGDNLSVAVSTGSQTLKKVLARMFPNFTIKDYDSIPACFDAVDSGDADLMIQNQYVVEYWLSKPKYDKLKVIPMIGLDDKLCFSAVVAFNGGEGSSAEDGQLLIDILDKTIDFMTEDEVGSYTIQGVMENQYQDTFEDFIYRYRYTVIMLGVLFVVIVVMAIIIVNQRLRVAKSRADAKAKGRFLSTMSHEIRTPLNGLIGLNYLMTRTIDDKAKLGTYLKQSSVTANYLLSLVNDILDASKLQEQKLELMLYPVDLKLMIQTVTSIERSGMEEKGLHFTVDTDYSYPYIIGDEVRIQQVLLNLLDNARKFTQRGGKVGLSLRQEKLKDGKISTRITVSDNGKGMSPEFLKKLFGVFSQELDTVSKGNQGTGLGLSISRRLARLMGGDLTCVSEKGEGSEFTFTFVGEECDEVQKHGGTQPADLAPTARILVAEDNELNGEIVLELLRSNGFEADLADNGKTALRMFAESKPGTYGFVLMDLLMPEMDGFQTAKAIRALDREDAKTVKIFACTANSFSEEKKKAIDSGMDDFITKPLNIEELFRKLRD